MKEHSEMSQFIENRRQEDEKSEEIINLLIIESENNIKSISESEMNLSIQLLLKQGQVEIEIDSFLEAIFVHREVVEDLNSQIKQYGYDSSSSITHNI